MKYLSKTHISPKGTAIVIAPCKLPCPGESEGLQAVGVTYSPFCRISEGF